MTYNVSASLKAGLLALVLTACQVLPQSTAPGRWAD